MANSIAKTILYRGNRQREEPRVGRVTPGRPSTAFPTVAPGAEWARSCRTILSTPAGAPWPGEASPDDCSATPEVGVSQYSPNGPSPSVTGSLPEEEPLALGRSQPVEPVPAGAITDMLVDRPSDRLIVPRRFGAIGSTLAATRRWLAPPTIRGGLARSAVAQDAPSGMVPHTFPR